MTPRFSKHQKEQRIRMTPQDWQELLSDPSNWPDESAENWPTELKLSYWATKEVWTDFTKLSKELEERGLSGLFQDVLVQLGYEVAGKGQNHLLGQQ